MDQVAVKLDEVKELLEQNTEELEVLKDKMGEEEEEDGQGSPNKGSFVRTMSKA